MLIPRKDFFDEMFHFGDLEPVWGRKEKSFMRHSYK